jgi:DNA polymerase III alpha subunit
LRTEHTAIELLYRGKSLKGVPLEPTSDVRLFVKHANLLDVGLPELLTDDTFGTHKWRLPDHYLTLDAEAYVRALTPDTPDSKQRVELELDEYRARNLLPVLRALIYIVDVLKKNKIVWGVGRGSSVASYVLFLIGVHRIDSLKYNISINEFFK